MDFPPFATSMTPVPPVQETKMEPREIPHLHVLKCIHPALRNPDVLAILE